MIQNYAKSAIRNLQKRPGYTFLNIFGLALGMTGCLLILQYVSYERGYDRFHKNSSDIFRLRLDAWQAGDLSWQSATVFPAFAPTMKRELPEVVDACRLHDAEFILNNPKTNLKFSEKKGYYADPPFLKMFSIDLISGNRETALEGPDKILLSETMAKKYFGRIDVFGEHLTVKDPNMLQTYEVTGVFKDYPKNSHLIIDYLVSYATLQKFINYAWQDTTNATETSWGWYDFYTYLQLKPGTDLAAFKAKLPAFADRHPNARYIERKIDLRNVIDILPMPDIHLYSNVNQEAEVNGDGRAVSVLFLVALFILGIAWINYVNLSTARSVERGREVGVRKVMGAMRGQLMRQFLTESLLLNVAAFALSIGATWLLLPAFRQFTGSDIPFDFLHKPFFWLTATGALLAGTALAGLYPAFVLSSFQPVSVLKGVLKNTAGGMLLRKGLTIFQFATSIALIAGTIVVYRQIQFMRSQNLGFNIEQTLVAEGAQTILDSLYEGGFEPFRNKILALPQVRSLTASSSVAGDEILWTNGSRLYSQGEQAPFHTLYNIGADEHFFKAYDLKVLAGRPFSKDFGMDVEGETILLNETAARTFGFDKPEDILNERILRGRDTLTVVGVTADFHHQGLQKAINPVAFLYRPDSRGYYSIKMAGQNASATIAAIQQVWDEHFPNDPFNYFFLDEFFNKQYQADLQFGRVFTLFSIVAILVACLGLMGLASYQIVQRTKEIGIRKVLGASVTGITGLLAKDFLKLVLVAFLLAVPIAWFLMDRWLEDFAYRISVQVWMFILAGLVAIAIAFLTVSFQSVRAALSNPVKSLRSE